jgi:hypothetical protein
MNDTDATCGDVTLSLCLRIYESSLYKQLVKRKPTQHTTTYYERYRADETKLVQNRLLLEGPLLDE